jgi:hypothetical protein
MALQHGLQRQDRLELKDKTIEGSLPHAAEKPIPTFQQVLDISALKQARHLFAYGQPVMIVNDDPCLLAPFRIWNSVFEITS